MTAWTSLLAASSLSSGTAWALLNAPKTGGTGVVINDGYTISIPDAMQLALADVPVGLLAGIDAYASLVQDEPIQLGLVPPTILETS